MGSNTSPAARYGSFHVAPQALISETINERAEEARQKDETEIVEERHVLLQPADVQDDQALCNGEGEGHHAEQQLETVEHHSVQSLADRGTVLPHLASLKKDADVRKQNDDSHKGEEKPVHGHFEQSLNGGGVEDSCLADHWSGQDIYAWLEPQQNEVHHGQDAAGYPQAQHDDPNSLRPPDDRTTQRVEDGYVALEGHGGQNEGTILEGGSGQEQHWGAEDDGKVDAAHH